MSVGPVMTLSSGGEGKGNHPIPSAVIGGLVVAAALIVAVLLVSSRQKGSEARGKIEDAPAYAAQITFSGLRLSAEENFLGQQVTYLDGSITNAGPKILRQLRVRLLFRDLMNQVVLRDEQDIVSGSPAVMPGQTRAFQVRFDHVPASWNQQVPEFQIISVRIQQP